MSVLNPVHAVLPGNPVTNEGILSTVGSPNSIDAEVARLLAQGSGLPTTLNAPLHRLPDGLGADRHVGNLGLIVENLETDADRLLAHGADRVEEAASPTANNDVLSPAIAAENQAVLDLHVLLENASHQTGTSGTVHAITHLGETVGLGEVGTGGLGGTGNLLTDVVQLPDTILNNRDLGSTIGQVVSHAGDVVGATGPLVAGLGADLHGLAGLGGDVAGQPGGPLANLDALGGATNPGGILGATLTGEDGRPLIDLDLVGDGRSQTGSHIVDIDLGPQTTASPFAIDILAGPSSQPGPTAGLNVGHGPTLVDGDVLTGANHLSEPALTGGSNASPIALASVLGGASESGGGLGAVVNQGFSTSTSLIDLDVVGDGRSPASAHLVEGLVGPASAGEIAGLNILTAPETLTNPISAIVGDGPSVATANVLTDAPALPALNAGGLDSLIGTAPAVPGVSAQEVVHLAGVSSPVLDVATLTPGTFPDAGQQHALLGGHGLI